MTVHRSSMWNKRPTRCHLVIYLFLLYNLLNMFRATLCPSSGADDLVVFIRCVAEPWLCRQADPVGCFSVHWEALSTTNCQYITKWHLVGLLFHIVIYIISCLYRGSDKSLAWPGRKQTNVSVRMGWISFGALPSRKKRTWWQLASRCCWNQASLTCLRAFFPSWSG